MHSNYIHLHYRAETEDISYDKYLSIALKWSRKVRDIPEIVFVEW